MTMRMEPEPEHPRQTSSRSEGSVQDTEFEWPPRGEDDEVLVWDPYGPIEDIAKATAKVLSTSLGVGPIVRSTPVHLADVESDCAAFGFQYRYLQENDLPFPCLDGGE